MDSTTNRPDIKDSNFRQLSELVVDAMERLHIPGVAVGILSEDKEYTAGFGVTSTDNPFPVDADTLFQIGSTTKTVTATSVMRLVEMGKLALELPIRTYLPDLRLSQEDVAARVTLRHIFTHTGGWIGDYFDDLGPGDDGLTKIVSKMADLKQLTRLGEIWSYNNSGFYIAGRVIEVVTGKTYEAAIKELVLDPIGMQRSFFFATEVMTYRFVVGHEAKDEEGPVVVRPWALPRTVHPAGGIISSVKDQLRYAHFHLGDGTTEDGTPLLTPKSLAFMQSPLAAAGNMADAVGVSWMLRSIGGTCIVEHGGATIGQVSAFKMVPERGFAITVMTNADRGGELNQEVCAWALRRYLGVAEPAPVLLNLPSEQLSAYVGKYDASLDTLELNVSNGGLVMQLHPKDFLDVKPRPEGPSPVRLAFFAEDRVIVLDPPMKDSRGEFLRDSDGNITWLRFGGRLHARQK
jgi:CubicO group peptidase (beta-lactamase class C family)